MLNFCANSSAKKLADDPQKTRSSARGFEVADELAVAGGWKSEKGKNMNADNDLASANGLADDWRMKSGGRSSAYPPPPYKVADAGGKGLAAPKTMPSSGPAKAPKDSQNDSLSSELVSTHKKHTITLELPWPPTGNHATKHTRTGGHYKTAETVAYRAAVLRLLAGMGLGKGQARKTSLRPLAGPLKASWVIAPPDHRARDLDNVRKEAADALTLAGLWVDDSCKVLRQETFEWVPPEPGGKVLLTVETLGNCTGVQSGENDSKKRA